MLSKIRTRDEVKQLAESFEEMVEGLRQKEFIRDTFGRYLTREVVQQLLESEDGILAFFGAPEPMQDHTARAVACALSMQAAMEEINALNEKDGYAHLEMGIAVHTGRVVVGNIGSEKRSKYGVVGSDVNFTGRIEGYTVGGQVLISHAAFERVKDHVDVRKTLTVQMKGIPGKVTLYDIRGIKGPYNVSLPDHDQAPAPLSKSIEVRVHRLQKKVMDKAGIPARITHNSRTSVIIVFDRKVETWEDIRIKLGADDDRFKEGEAFGKVISVRRTGEGWEATVRMTSLSPQVFQRLKDTGSA